MTNRKVLSPAEWQSVSNSLIELSERMEQAGKAAQSASDAKGTTQKERPASRRNEKSND
jgi:hypothetical protein